MEQFGYTPKQPKENPEVPNGPGTLEFNDSGNPEMRVNEELFQKRQRLVRLERLKIGEVIKSLVDLFR